MRSARVQIVSALTTESTWEPIRLKLHTLTSSEVISVSLTHSSTDPTSLTSTSDPWQNEEHITGGSTAAYYYGSNLPEWDYASMLREIRREASRVLPPRENRAQARSHVRARHGFQQMARLPCYRAVRAR